MWKVSIHVFLLSDSHFEFLFIFFDGGSNVGGFMKIDIFRRVLVCSVSHWNLRWDQAVLQWVGNGLCMSISERKGAVDIFFANCFVEGNVCAVVAEWLRRLTRNQLGSARTGSNPVHCEKARSCFFSFATSFKVLSGFFLFESDVDKKKKERKKKERTDRFVYISYIVSFFPLVTFLSCCELPESEQLKN